jgi:hypothetical protein
VAGLSRNRRLEGSGVTFDELMKPADDLRRALEGRELASGTLVGTYQR